MLQWTFVYMCPYSRTIYSALDIFPVMGLLGQMEFLFLVPWGISTLSSTMVELIYTPANSVKCYFSTSSPASNVSWFLMITILNRLRWYLNMFLFCFLFFVFDGIYTFKRRIIFNENLLNNYIKKCVKDMNRHFSKEDIHTANKHMKKC